MFQLTMNNATNMAFPDVCLTPTPGGPVPMPYPNISLTSTALPPTTAMTILVNGTPSLNLLSEIPLSNGDEAGVNMGTMSGMIMGPTSYIMGSETLMLKGAPAVKLTSQTGQNGESMNTSGTCIVPSQVKMIVLS
ncbi:MAG: DUF4150 domain-containing protein [Campylobacterota bacterium]|nr:DUF4150 domain-containing protein [Campylobacterota bacterium]